jgi:hypothetical protein
VTAPTFTVPCKCGKPPEHWSHLPLGTCAYERDEGSVEYAALKLFEACDAAMAWAAGYPLQGTGGQPDAQAAGDVYRRTEEALALARARGIGAEGG